MSVTTAKTRLLQLAMVYAADSRSAEKESMLLIAAEQYWRAKRSAANARDRWKARKKGLL